MNLRSRFPSVRSLLAVVSVAVAALGLTAQAHASKSQQSMLQDDRLLQNSIPQVQTQALDNLQSAGVKAVHTIILWNNLAPSPTKASVPSGVNLTDPNSYDANYWTRVDRLVNGAQARGMQVLISIAGPAPRWAETCNSFERSHYGREKGTCKPSAKLYGQFVTAVAKRYDGTFKDASGNPIAKVKRFSIWNEPNLNSWISPQIQKFRGQKVSVGAKIYRNLVYAGTKALRANGHRRDQILLGETAPIGQGSIRTTPALFYQTLFCINAKGRKLGGVLGKNAGCKSRMKRLDVNGVAHHPYTKRAVQTPLAKQRSTDITMADLGMLSKILKQGVHRRMLKASATGLYLTEYGVSTRPPAKTGYGVPLSRQAEWINEFEYLAFKNSKVKTVTQFQLEDDAGLSKTKTFQTGLRFADGRDKPSFAAYLVPLFVQNKGKKFTVWGGVRGKSGTVTIFNGRKKVKTVRLRRGYFMTTVAKRKGSWHLEYKTGATTLKSRTAAARKLPKGF
jgi:hypothetical protein